MESACSGVDINLRRLGLGVQVSGILLFLPGVNIKVCHLGVLSGDTAGSLHYFL